MTQTSEIPFSASVARNQINESQWTDETGITVPATRITKSERNREKFAFKLYNASIKLNKELAEHKATVQKICQQVYEDAMAALKQAESKKAGKGNFSWYNFDRSIKVEVSINERIDFDDITIKAAKEQLDNFLSETLNDKEEFIRQLINDAFSNTKGGLDAKRILSLLRYRGKIKAANFQEALNLIEKSIRKPDSKQYIRMSYRDGNGEYHLIDLNFSSI